MGMGKNRKDLPPAAKAGRCARIWSFIIIVIVVTVGALRCLGTGGRLRTGGRLGTGGRLMSTRLTAMTKASGEFFKVNAFVVIRIQSVKDGGHALRISAFKRGKGGKFVGVKRSVITCNFSKFFLALGFKGGPAGFAGAFPLFVGKFAIGICVKFCDVCSAAFSPGRPAGFAGGLTLLFVDLSVVVEVELFEDFGKISVTKGSLTSGTGETDADSDRGNGEIFQFHGHLGGMVSGYGDRRDWRDNGYTKSRFYSFKRSKRFTPCCGSGSGCGSAAASCSGGACPAATGPSLLATEASKSSSNWATISSHQA